MTNIIAPKYTTAGPTTTGPPTTTTAVPTFRPYIPDWEAQAIINDQFNKKAAAAHDPAQIYKAALVRDAVIAADQAHFAAEAAAALRPIKDQHIWYHSGAGQVLAGSAMTGASTALADAMLSSMENQGLRNLMKIARVDGAQAAGKDSLVGDPTTTAYPAPKVAPCLSTPTTSHAFSWTTHDIHWAVTVPPWETTFSPTFAPPTTLPPPPPMPQFPFSR